MTGDGRGAEDGSTLVESLVAFAILAGAATMAFRVFGEGLQRQSVSAAQTETLQLAQAEIARLGALKSFKTGTAEGPAFRIAIVAVGSGERDAVRPFHVSLWKSGSAEDAPPLLETIVLGTEAAP